MLKAINIIEYEIEWHKQNKSKAPSETAAEYFIKGMEHLLDLFYESRFMEEND